MAENSTPSEVILLVDDEESVRRTFTEWLESADLGCRLLVSGSFPDAIEQSDRLIDEGQSIDLAILDWNLGAGFDGLQLLSGLRDDHPDVVAIMITGYAHKATPLDAMRMGVRDYFDKSHKDLTRQSFLDAVRKQLAHIRPAKRERRVREQLHAFRSSLEKVVPLVRTSAALHDRTSLPDAVSRLFRLLIQNTAAVDGALLVHSYDENRDPPEVFRAFDQEGNPLPDPSVPFAQTLASSVIGQQQACSLAGADLQENGMIELLPFEKDRTSLLATPIEVDESTRVVLELYDKVDSPEGFDENDSIQAATIASLATEMLRHALAHRQNERILFDAIDSVLEASQSLSSTIDPQSTRAEAPPPAEVLDTLRESWQTVPSEGMEAEESLRLAEAIRVLHLRHGPRAIDHCIVLIENLGKLLDEVTGQ